MSFVLNMKIQNQNNSFNFKSGLTGKIIKDIVTTNIEKAQADFAKIGTEADFRGKKAVCANFVYATNILYDISEKYKLPFDFVPYAIKVYENKELINPHEYFAFATNETGNVLKNEPAYIGGSIFVNKKLSGLFLNDYIITKHYLLGKRSSPHFLSNTLHEWFHTIQMNLIYKKYGYEGICPVLSKEYRRPGLNKGVKKLDSLDTSRDLTTLPKDFKKYIGSYAIRTNSYLELLAELMTKITTLSLDKDLNVVKNPLDNLPKDLPKEVKCELEKFLDI